MNSTDATAVVVDALEACSIEYMLVGALSSNAYGVSRSTKDADFVVEVRPGHLKLLMAKLGPEFHLDPQMQMETITGSFRNVIKYLPTKFDIELFRINTRDEHHVVRFSRRYRRHLAEIKREVWLPTVEDVVIQKLRWKRRKDLDDIVNVLAVSGSIIDWDYLRGWSIKHGTNELLDELLTEVPELPE